ncbi:MAG: DUF202 domain-containing protein [Planctomycetaceae bacterium]|nr:DUF202 domain-containing protein [Planctomycetaceae bacterium]
MPYRRFEGSELILRDELAIDRTRLANERTFLSYLRTALTLAVVAGTLMHLYHDQPLMVALAILFFAAAAVCFIMGVCKTIGMTRQIRYVRKEAKPSGS